MVCSLKLYILLIAIFIKLAPVFKKKCFLHSLLGMLEKSINQMHIIVKCISVARVRVRFYSTPDWKLSFHR